MAAITKSGQVSPPKPAEDPGQEGTLTFQVAAMQKQIKNLQGGKGVQRSNTRTRSWTRRLQQLQEQRHQASGWASIGGTQPALALGPGNLILFRSTQLPLEGLYSAKAQEGLPMRQCGPQISRQLGSQPGPVGQRILGPIGILEQVAPPEQGLYTTYRRELLAIKLAIRHFISEI